MISLDEVLRARLPIHGETRTLFGIHEDLARLLDAQLRPEHVTLETGAGRSTLVILRRGVRRHIAIQPDPVEFEGIREYCLGCGIATEALEAVAARSQDYFPSAHLPDLDLVLIDGDHSFPAPFLDWYFTAERLRVGGLMAVDDTDILTGTFLADFMGADLKWEEICRHHSGRFAVYRKAAHPIHEDHWGFQPFLKDSYPVRRLRAVRRRMPGRFERKISRLMPRRLQTMIRSKIGWPAPE
jgi:methyltransferase family protein